MNNIDISNNDNISNKVYVSNNYNISPTFAVSTKKSYSSSDIISSDVEDSDNVIEIYEQNENISESLEYIHLTNLLKINQNKINVLEDFQEENQILKNKIIFILCA